MFEEHADSRLVWFSTDALCDNETLKEYTMLGNTTLNHLLSKGKLIGLALYNSVTINLAFPLLFFKGLLGECEPTLKDLTELDPILGKSLKALLNFDGDVEDVFQYTFEIEVQSITGAKLFVELIEGGCNTNVTNANRASIYHSNVLTRRIC